MGGHRAGADGRGSAGRSRGHGHHHPGTGDRGHQCCRTTARCPDESHESPPLALPRAETGRDARQHVGRGGRVQTPMDRAPTATKDSAGSGLAPARLRARPADALLDVDAPHVAVVVPDGHLPGAGALGAADLEAGCVIIETEHVRLRGLADPVEPGPSSIVLQRQPPVQGLDDLGRRRAPQGHPGGQQQDGRRKAVTADVRGLPQLPGELGAGECLDERPSGDRAATVPAGVGADEDDRTVRPCRRDPRRRLPQARRSRAPGGPPGPRSGRARGAPPVCAPPGPLGAPAGCPGADRDGVPAAGSPARPWRGHRARRPAPGRGDSSTVPCGPTAPAARAGGTPPRSVPWPRVAHRPRADSVEHRPSGVTPGRPTSPPVRRLLPRPGRGECPIRRGVGRRPAGRPAARWPRTHGPAWGRPTRAAGRPRRAGTVGSERLRSRGPWPG